MPKVAKENLFDTTTYRIDRHSSEYRPRNRGSVGRRIGRPVHGVVVLLEERADRAED
jgi:hypothetical protein